jgi:E-phenylitaconyl-CoA hydratase
MSVDVALDGPVATITLNRPEKLNAMDKATYRALDETFERIDADPDIRAAVLTGAGDRAFSAGADLERMHGDDSAPRGWGTWKPDSWSFGRVPRTPLIAAIHGYALAGGLELALTCDLRIATPQATFGAPEVKWALLDGLGAWRLPAVVGLGHAMELLLTADFIDAEHALRIGLVNRIVERDALLPTAQALAARIAENHPAAVQMTKEIALRSAHANADEVMRLYRSYYAILEAAPEQPGAIRKFSERDRT